MDAFTKTYPNFFQSFKPTVTTTSPIPTTSMIKPAKKHPKSITKSGSEIRISSDQTRGRSTSDAKGFLMNTSTLSEQQHKLKKQANTPNSPPIQTSNLRVNFLSPIYALRCELDNYFREAKNHLQLFIYQCECWINDTLQSDLIIPFIQFAELGIAPELKALVPLPFPLLSFFLSLPFISFPPSLSSPSLFPSFQPLVIVNIHYFIFFFVHLYLYSNISSSNFYGAILNKQSGRRR